MNAGGGGPVRSRWLRAPLMSLAIAVFWLAINNSVHPVHLLTAMLLAVGLPLLTDRFRDDRPRVGRARVAARLVAVVLWDVFVSNIEVAKLILTRPDHLETRFIRLRTRLTDPHAVALLAGIVTMTPGTLSADISADRTEILIHNLHAPDPDAVAAAIRDRYEAPLAEIFGC